MNKISSTAPLFSLTLSDISFLSGTKDFDWEVFPAEVHLVTGLSGKSKEALYSSFSSMGFPLVSFEEASKIIEQERKNDDSEFMEGGIDPGRSVKTFLNLEEHGYDEKLIALCGIGSILERGLKYLSTGEMRRILMYRALSSSSPVLILDNPLDGLDSLSRETVITLIKSLPRIGTTLILLTEDTDLLDYASHVFYTDRETILFNGSKEMFLKTDMCMRAENYTFNEESFKTALSTSSTDNKYESRLLSGGNKKIRAEYDECSTSADKKELVRMVNVTVQWDGRKVLENVSWTVHEGDHTLVQGSNGCGKTTLLELITGDNQQVYANDVYLFGSKRGSGETIWDIKAKLGIVSYKLHLEYRLVKGYSVEQVVVSGFYDSIGLYTKPLESEVSAALLWLDLAGLRSLSGETFSSLSYGEQRAVLIIRAVVKHPPLLILDEPCHSLDVHSRAFVLNLLQKIADTGKTTLIHVTHDTTEILPCEKYLFQFKPGESPMYELRTLK